MTMAVMLWSQVHGIVSLRIAQPDLPWPPIEEQVMLMFECLTEGLCTKKAMRRLGHPK